MHRERTIIEILRSWTFRSRRQVRSPTFLVLVESPKNLAIFNIKNMEDGRDFYVPRTSYGEGKRASLVAPRAREKKRKSDFNRETFACAPAFTRGLPRPFALSESARRHVELMERNFFSGHGRARHAARSITIRACARN